jgi:hypothetical protein
VDIAASQRFIDVIDLRLNVAECLLKSIDATLANLFEISFGSSIELFENSKHKHMCDCVTLLLKNKTKEATKSKYFQEHGSDTYIRGSLEIICGGLEPLLDTIQSSNTKSSKSS